MNIKTKLLVSTFLIAMLTAAGCGNGNPAFTPKDEMRTVCLDGVTYYLFREQAGYSGWGYMSVKLDRNSKVVPCDH